MLYEVKIYDGGGNLLKIVSPQELENKTTENIRSMFSKRDREHIMSLENDEQAVQMHSYHMA
ncbi:MAG: hypothetical protein NPINA01_20970 [Nitrospinaceae bacterium]|nr:MAG: hypothetical protein NPINA01_20970 [Nitrospinaceae bacterium]